MSEDTKPEFRATLLGDWWMLAAAFEQLALLSYKDFVSNVYQAVKSNECRVELFSASIGPSLVFGKVTFKEQGPHTAIEWEQSERPDLITPLIELLAKLVDRARSTRRRAGIASTEEAIELYYRSRAAGGKLTLKEIAAQFGFNYKYLSSAKSAYDKRGGWGSNIQVDQDRK